MPRFWVTIRLMRFVGFVNVFVFSCWRVDAGDLLCVKVSHKNMFLYVCFWVRVYKKFDGGGYGNGLLGGGVSVRRAGFCGELEHQRFGAV